ncbi:MAG: hypothetical protein KC413_25365, partial [Anaerolineales bacterium]|nr:hypothetical protein [Anaerolineales bacterium]
QTKANPLIIAAVNKVIHSGDFLFFSSLFFCVNGRFPTDNPHLSLQFHKKLEQSAVQCVQNHHIMTNVDE